MKKMIIAAIAAFLAFGPAVAQERGGRHGGFGGGFGGFGRGGGFERGGGFGGRGPGFGGFPGARGPGGPGRFGGGGPYGGPALGPPGGFAPRFAPPRVAPYGGGGGGGFRRGQFLPQGYWNGGAVADPRQYHLRRPPNGYGWVTVGPNAYLMQRSTGLILDTAPLY